MNRLWSQKTFLKMYYDVPFYDNIKFRYALYSKLHRGQKFSTENILLSLSHSCSREGVYKIAHMPTLLKHYSSTALSITISHAVSARTVPLLSVACGQCSIVFWPWFKKSSLEELSRWCSRSLINTSTVISFIMTLGGHPCHYDYQPWAG